MQASFTIRPIVGGNLYSVPDATRRRILDVHVFAD
jgi:hypothetical protein